MRYSIKWLLVVMAYIALIVAAITSLNRTLASIAWLLSYCTICYALVVSFIAGDQRRAMAIGFVVLAVGHILCIYLAPRELPALRMLSTLGYGIGDDYASLYAPNTLTTAGPNRGVPARRKIPNSYTAVRTLNAVGTILAGLLGAGIGALAYKYAVGKSD
jgi:hypothetical protein